MSDTAAHLRNIRQHLATGRFGQREVWEEQLEDAAEEIERLQAQLVSDINAENRIAQLEDEIERLRAREQGLLESCYQLALKLQKIKDPDFRPMTGMDLLK